MSLAQHHSSETTDQAMSHGVSVNFCGRRAHVIADQEVASDATDACNFTIILDFCGCEYLARHLV